MKANLARAMACSLALACYSVAIGGANGAVALVAVMSVSLAVLAIITCRATLLGATPSMHAMGYLLALLLGDTEIDLGAPAVGIALYVLTVSLHPLEERSLVEAPVRRHRLTFGVAVLGGSAAAGFVVVWVGSASRVAGPLALLLGSVAALAVLGAIARAARTALDRTPSAGG